MRVLITGADGQLGTELVRAFQASGTHEVVGCDRSSFDLADRDSVMGSITSLTPDAIVHAGAWTAVDDCESQPDRAFQVNALGTRHVVNAARTVGARVLYLSTDYVFDGTADRPYNEWDQPNPQSVYGRSKLGGEMEVGEEDTIVRTSWVFGSTGANMVKTLLRLAESSPEVSFVNDQYGNPTSAADLAGCIYDLVAQRRPGVFHVTNAGATTWYGFARTVFEAAGHDADRVKSIATSELKPQRPAPRPANSVFDNAALRLQGLPELPDHHEAVQQVVKELLSQ